MSANKKETVNVQDAEIEAPQKMIQNMIYIARGQQVMLDSDLAILNALQLDITKHNAQYPPIQVSIIQNVHDRFLIVDDDIYHIGASFKDLGRKLFAFSKMEIPPEVILQQPVTLLSKNVTDL